MKQTRPKSEGEMRGRVGEVTLLNSVITTFSLSAKIINSVIKNDFNFK